MDWSQLMFLVGNVLGILIKRSPNTLAIFRDKLIPGWIFVAMLIGQFISGTGVEAAQASTGTVMAIAWGGLLNAFWGAFVETAKAVLLHQLAKQAKKPE